MVRSAKQHQVVIQTSKHQVSPSEIYTPSGITTYRAQNYSQTQLITHLMNLSASRHQLIHSNPTNIRQVPLKPILEDEYALMNSILETS